MTLNQNTITKILHMHDVETFQHEGKLYAVTTYTKRIVDSVVPGEAIVDVTDSTNGSLRVFLNY